MKLEPNRDGEPVPGVQAPPKEWEPDSPIEKWIAAFPYDSIPPDGNIQMNFRCGEIRDVGGMFPKEHRRLRISILLSDWAKLSLGAKTYGES